MNAVTILIAFLVIAVLAFAGYMAYRELKEESGSDDGMTPTMHCRIKADSTENVQ